MLITIRRSLGLCILTQVGSFVIALPTLQVEKDHLKHDLFLAIVFIPYTICMLACLACALYVVKALLCQILRDNRVSLRILLESYIFDAL